MNLFQAFIIISCFFTFHSCVDKRDLSQNTVIAHIASSPNGLHPVNNNSGDRSYIFQYTQKTLVKMDLITLKTIPVLVKTMPIVSEDGLEYTYELIDGVKWDDGELLTLDDIIFSTKLQIAPLTNNPNSKGVYNSIIKEVIKDEENPSKFILRTKIVHVSNLNVFTEIYLLQKSHWDPSGILDAYSFTQINNPTFTPSVELEHWFVKFNHSDNSYQPTKLVGLGPYQITDFVVGAYITLSKKKNWYGQHSDNIYDKSYPDKIIFKIINDDASTYLAIKNQQIDVAVKIGTAKMLKLQSLDYFNKNYYSGILPDYSYTYLGLNMRPDGVDFKPLFVEQKVRRAISHMVPVDEIIAVVAKGKAYRQVAQTSPLHSAYNKDLIPVSLDIEKAKKLLEESGWIDTDGDNIRDKVINGQRIPFSFKLSYMNGPASIKETVLIIKESMYKAGVELIPSPMDFSLFYKNAQDHQFDAMMGAWGGSAGYEDPRQLWHTESWANKGFNFTGFGDAISDSLIQLANTSLDKEKHETVTKALQAKIYEDQPYVFLYSLTRKIIIHKRFTNATMYNEKPGVILSNLQLKPEYGGILLKPEQ